MRKIKIEAIMAGPDGRLRIKPCLPPDKDYQYIWRDASSVRWDAGSLCLFALDIRGFEFGAYLRQIVAAVKSEYGDDLTVTSSTVVSGLPEAWQREVKKYQAEAEQGDEAESQ